jgi:hypothetical protein
MLGNDPFYNRTIRKIVVAFGTIFNDIVVVRQLNGDGLKKERFKVPLSYGPKEKYIYRLTSDPTLFKSIATVVPRISFNLEGLEYDSGRKQVSTLQNFSVDTSGKMSRQYVPIPYNFEFSLSIYTRNTEDGTQILEQILPFFTPDFTVTVDFISTMNQKYDLPIILNSVTSSVEYEGDMSTTRLIIWDLNFTVKGFIWPIVKSDSNSGLIGAEYTDSNGNTAYGKVITNFYQISDRRDAQKVYVDYANGVNYFLDTELFTVQNRDDVTGQISYFSNTSSGILLVSNITSLLQANDVIVGSYSKAKYTVTSTDKTPQKIATVIIQSDPLGANPEDDYGFTDTITEWPDTL